MPAGLTLRQIWGAGDGVVWAVTTESERDEVAQTKPGSILRWDGTAWTSVFSTAKGLTSIAGASGNDLWAGGTEGIFHGVVGASGQLEWNLDTSLPAGRVTSIWCADANRTWAVADGAIYRRDALGGGAWRLDPTIPTLPMNAAYARVWGSPSALFVAGGRFEPAEVFGAQILWRSSLPGADGTWHPILEQMDLKPSFSAAAFVPPASVWALSTQGGTPEFWGDNLVTNAFVVGRANPNGEYAITSERLGATDILRAVWGRSESDVWIGGSYGQLRHWNGTRFDTARTALRGLDIQDGIVQNGFHSIWGDADGDLWVVGREVALHRKASP
ncbi:hypothetical protein AKJ09_07002 [Labilithrix luteola]|uniref:Type IV fimbrial biogenesis protein PilY1 n=1 Tax=Labilithrix luteola TaxID=1391654 RepID=A0A0K1Q3J9_9BACT|nr:hypothetical protein AKJ09_07002 [Labilithrix luteola]